MKKTNQMLEWCDSQTFFKRASELIETVSIVMDIGCGIRPQQFVIPDFLICVEPHLEYVEILKKNLDGTNSIIISLDAKQALSALPDNAVDSIFLIDVIEHMTKEIGLEVISESERVARKQVVLFTPLGFMPQETHASSLDGWNLHGGTWQDHKSGWYPEDFLDWHVLACKHLHIADFKGQPINPPYGGFYAIKTLVKSTNYFNEIYSQEVLLDSTSNLNAIRTIFPQFIDQVVSREIERSNMKCAIQSCQRTTILFIEQKATKSVNEIFDIITLEKTDNYLKEAREYNVKIREFASQFLDFNFRESELKVRDELLTTREAELRVRDELLTTREAVISKNIYVRIYRKLKNLFDIAK
ncbi:hypothetical protein [Candidatus Tisiphia endosymbiont of Metellina segmentata]|uniref:hypothetical protein n=1 Tax=Candidatus Tisiphia endosymbiont of Metellina segmentata TaxID=3066274 RepID=UPI00313D0C94